MISIFKKPQDEIIELDFSYSSIPLSNDLLDRKAEEEFRKQFDVKKEKKGTLL